MRHEYELVPIQFTPTTRILSSKIEKINRPIIFTAVRLRSHLFDLFNPFDLFDFRIDLQKRARFYERVKRVIL